MVDATLSQNILMIFSAAAATEAVVEDDDEALREKLRETFARGAVDRSSDA